jgi:hypothetical protein
MSTQPMAFFMMSWILSHFHGGYQHVVVSASEQANLRKSLEVETPIGKKR